VHISDTNGGKILSATKSSTLISQEMLHFQILKRNDIYTVVTIQGHELIDIGVLDERVGKALRSLDLVAGVTDEAISEVIHYDGIVRRRQSGKKESHIMKWIIEVNIYGPQASKEEVGKILTTTKFHLQTPRGISCDIVVNNPHLITFPNLPSKSPSIQLPTASPTPASSIHTKPDGLIEIFDGLDQHESFQPGDNTKYSDIDSGLATKLLEYVSLNVNFTISFANTTFIVTNVWG